MRKPVIIANWKMHKTIEESKRFFEDLLPLVKDMQEVEIVLCVPYTILPLAQKYLEGTNIAWGAQNMFYAEEGAYTGEISSEMLLDLACEYVILGHSERREIFQEDDQTINLKLKKALEKGLKPILCIGESLEEREDKKTLEKCKSQLEKGLLGIAEEKIEEIIIAYEPIWAIGTGQTAEPEDAEETIASLRDILQELYGNKVSQRVRIQYGGSVKPENIREFMAKDNIDGALVGGASLEAESFSKIINYKE